MILLLRSTDLINQLRLFSGGACEQLFVRHMEHKCTDLKCIAQ